MFVAHGALLRSGRVAQWPSLIVAVPRLRGFCTTTPNAAPATPALLHLRDLKTDEHHALARSWLERFVLDDVPRHAYEVSYARSSGPGGQHVNKTNSKAVVRCDIHRAKGEWLPPFVVDALQQSPHYHAPDLLFASQTTRSAHQNLEAALANLHSTIVRAGRGLVRGQTSAAQKARVRGHMDAEKRRNREMKEKHKSKKESRRRDW